MPRPSGFASKGIKVKRGIDDPMAPDRSGKESPPQVLPAFAPAFFDLWQIVLPRDNVVVYIREREG